MVDVVDAVTSVAPGWLVLGVLAHLANQVARGAGWHAVIGGACAAEAPRRRDAIAAWVAITLNFVLPRLIPGDPVQIMLARQSQLGPVSPGQERALAAMLGLGDGNLLSQYW